MKPKNHGKWNGRVALSNRIELAIGMKVMVTFNIKTDLGIANGARGEIIKIFGPWPMTLSEEIKEKNEELTIKLPARRKRSLDLGNGQFDIHLHNENVSWILPQDEDWIQITAGPTPDKATNPEGYKQACRTFEPVAACL
ncbi:hypothetical protein K503DRAFT_857290 [Rhizopogon vinicolor AM-OR11-026]|uniref:Uncharacterized protein n=1 Tax=Rhizopogon vinicolor AM-OR11-026 TaxID=1314800 RepID=A0A1B7MYA6_9AGAM|nr:hypothetical protein K503DRAFT_857290 [Rhizopogon vinicolor AM-OR11-026]